MNVINESCLKKTRFATEKAAKLPGFRVYRCSFCGGFHRTTKGVDARKMGIDFSSGGYALKGVR